MEMSGDPSRRPSNDRIRLPHVNTRVVVQCRHCMGDGWHYPWFGSARWKIRCADCEGTGRSEIFLIEKHEDDVVVGGVK